MPLCWRAVRIEAEVRTVNVIIRSQHVPISPALEEHCRERIARAVHPFVEQLDRVELVFVDLNGPRNAPAQACRVFVALNGGARVLFESRQRDFYLAASRAIFGAGRHLARAVARSRARTHRGLSSLAREAMGHDGPEAA